MIPKEIAVLADALQEESMDLSREHAVEIAHNVAANMRKAGYRIQEIFDA